MWYNPPMSRNTRLSAAPHILVTIPTANFTQRKILEGVLAYAREAGCHDVTLNVWELNPGARAFYERMGMRPLKTCMETLL